MRGFVVGRLHRRSTSAGKGSRLWRRQRSTGCERSQFSGEQTPKAELDRSMEVLRDWLRDAMQQQDGEDRGWPAFSMMALCT
jgi:hypothetical protein